jgi:hypothetical protein
MTVARVYETSRPRHGADADVWEPMEEFYENAYIARNKPICLDKLPDLGAAATPG